MSAVTSHCPHCGSELEADCDFCPGCGVPTVESQLPPARPAQAPHSWMAETAPERPTYQSGSLAQPQYVAPQYVAQTPYASYAPGPTVVQSNDVTANTARTLGIVVVSLMVVGLVPCLGWLNYITLILAFATLIVSIIAAANAKTSAARSAATMGLVFALLGGFVGFIRLLLGGGCL